MDDSKVMTSINEKPPPTDGFPAALTTPSDEHNSEKRDEKETPAKGGEEKEKKGSFADFWVKRCVWTTEVFNS